MPKLIQLRDVSDDLHCKPKLRAREADMTLSDFLLREGRVLADRPTIEELLARNAGPVFPRNLSVIIGRGPISRGVRWARFRVMATEW